VKGVAKEAGGENLGDGTAITVIQMATLAALLASQSGITGMAYRVRGRE
jgi:K+ transporter